MKIGLLGAGHLGKIHLKCLLASTCWEVAGFYEPNEEQAASALRQYPVHRYATLEDLFSAVDVVDIVTPTPTHYKLAARALQAGKHVFIEKPVTQTVAEGRKLLALAEKTGMKVQVGHVERYNPAFLALRGMALQPMFIESHRLSVFQPRGTDVSVILDLMIHDLDLVLHLIPAPLTKVSASGVAVLSDTPDIANARLEFANGAVANLTASRISLKQMRKMRLFQPDHYLSLDFLDKNAQIVRLYDRDAKGLPPEEQLMEFDTARGKKWLHLQMPDHEPVNAIQMELEAFHKAIVEGSEPEVSLQDGLRALDAAKKVLHAIAVRQSKIGFNLEKDG